MYLVLVGLFWVSGVGVVCFLLATLLENDYSAPNRNRYYDEILLLDETLISVCPIRYYSI